MCFPKNWISRCTWNPNDPCFAWKRSALNMSDLKIEDIHRLRTYTSYTWYTSYTNEMKSSTTHLGCNLKLIGLISSINSICEFRCFPIWTFRWIFAPWAAELFSSLVRMFSACLYSPSGREKCRVKFFCWKWIFKVTMFCCFFWILHVFPKITSVSLKVLHRSWFHPVADATWPPPQGGLVTRFLVVFLMYLFEWAVIKSSLIWNRNPPNPLPAHNSLSIHMSVYMSIRQNYGKSKVVLSGLVVCRHSPNLHKR